MPIPSCCVSTLPWPRKNAGPFPNVPGTRWWRRRRKAVKLGGLNAKGVANREEAQQRAEALRPVFAGLAGMSHRKMAAELNAMGVPTPAGGQWHAVTVKRVLERIG
jgi:hypothetical protein